MMELKELVFFRAKAEFDAYTHMCKSSIYSTAEMDSQRDRFSAVWQIIEEAELEAEYQDWKEAQQ